MVLLEVNQLHAGYGRAPALCRGRGHAGRNGAEAPLERAVHRLEELRQHLRGAPVERETSFRRGAELAIPALDQLLSAPGKDAADPLHEGAPGNGRLLH